MSEIGLGQIAVDETNRDQGRLQDGTLRPWQGPLVTIINDDGDTMVSINRDGTVTYGADVDLDDASRRFWDSLAAHIPPTITNGGSA